MHDQITQGLAQREDGESSPPNHLESEDALRRAAAILARGAI
ncbi:MAG: hypothetical protein ACD_75C00731G0001, partial [uncultured bacterium]